MLFILDLVGRGEIRLVTEPLTRYRRHPRGQSANLTGIIDSHRALMQWLQEREEVIDAEERQSIAAARLEILIRNAWGMKARRRWKEYWAFRNYLEDYRRQSDDPVSAGLAALTSNRIYPRFAYQLRDLFLGGPASQ